MFYQHLFLLIASAAALGYTVYKMVFYLTMFNAVLKQAEGKGNYFYTSWDFLDWLDKNEFLYKGKSYKGGDVITSHTLNFLSFIVSAIIVLYHLIYLLP